MFHFNHKAINFYFKFVANNLFADHNADAFKPPGLSTSIGNYWLVQVLFDGFSKWDAQHFLHVSKFNYIYEHSTAFFPLFPLCINCLSRFLSVNGHTSDSIYLLSGVLLNLIFFNLACIYLFKLTLIIFNQSKAMALYSVMFFCMNPANIFFSALYSESLYSLLLFSSLFYLITSVERSSVLHFFISLFLFFLSGLCRSNGILNFGYIAYFCLKERALLIDHTRTGFCNFFKSILFNTIGSFRFTVKILFSFFSVNLALFLYQFYIYERFCKLDDMAKRNIMIPIEHVEYARENNYFLYNDLNKVPEWCHYKLPLSYSYVQSVYWKVGFLNYWQFKQIPNFLLAFPIIFLSVYSLKSYLTGLNSKNVFNFLGLLEKKSSKQMEFNFYLIPFALHLIALLVSSIFFMHIQVKHYSF